MADNNRTDNTNAVPEGINSISDEEVITEINIGEFLNEKESDAVLYEGYHEDIQKTEQSLEDEIQSLMDSIMNTGTAPAGESKPKPESALDDLWMNPEDYISVPRSAKPKPAVPFSEENATSKDEILGMIDSLKDETANEKDFEEIITGIEENNNLESIDIEKSGAETIASAEAVEQAAKSAPEPPVSQPAKPKKANDIDIYAEGFEDELAVLLGDKPSSEEETAPQRDEPKDIEIATPAKKENFTVTIPDGTLSNLDEADNASAIEVNDLLPQNTGKTVGNVPVEIIEDDGKISRAERKQAKKEQKIADGKNPKVGEIIRRVVLAVSIIVIIVSSAILVKTYIYEPMMFKKHQDTIQNIVTEPANAEDVSQTVAQDDTEYPEGMLAKYKQLYAINKDLKGWISIPGLEINLPIAQGKDNDYYLHRNIYGKRTNYGVPFFDYRIEDFKNLPRNTVVYGHNMHYDDYIFGMLENYREISGFKQAPVIECNTIYADYQWFVYAAFITNSKASQDNGYMLSYNFLDISTQKFTEYIKEIDKRKFYTTGVDILPTDKILTLSTCCYDFDEARLVIIARLRRDGESSMPDVSKAVKNENPKYPQAWYTANKKTNPYADDVGWYPNS